MNTKMKSRRAAKMICDQRVIKAYNQGFNDHKNGKQCNPKSYIDMEGKKRINPEED